MPKLVNVEGVGRLSFPDDATQEEILGFVNQRYGQKAAPEASPVARNGSLSPEFASGGVQIPPMPSERAGEPIAGPFQRQQAPEPSMAEPYVPLPKLPVPEGLPMLGTVEKAALNAQFGTALHTLSSKDPVLGVITRQAINNAIGAVEFTESPAGVMSAIAGTVAPAATTAAFTGYMSHALVDEAKRTYTDWDQMSATEKATAIVNVASTAAFTAMAAGGTAAAAKRSLVQRLKASGAPATAQAVAQQPAPAPAAPTPAAPAKPNVVVQQSPTPVSVIQPGGSQPAKPSAEPTVTITEDPTKLVVTDLRVPLDQQGQGVGGEMIEKAKAKADETGKPLVVTGHADSPAQQVALDKFYDEHGVKQISSDPVSGKPIREYTPTPKEPDAISQGKKPESGEPEHQGIAPQRTSTEAINRNRVEPSPQVGAAPSGREPARELAGGAPGEVQGGLSLRQHIEEQADKRGAEVGAFITPEGPEIPDAMRSTIAGGEYEIDRVKKGNTAYTVKVGKNKIWVQAEDMSRGWHPIGITYLHVDPKTGKSTFGGTWTILGERKANPSSWRLSLDAADMLTSELGNIISKVTKGETPEVTPAIKTPAGDVVTGKDHVDAYSKAKETVSPDTSGSKEGFVDATGKFISREQAAAQTGLPTNVEPGRLHTSDVPPEPTNLLKDVSGKPVVAFHGTTDIAFDPRTIEASDWGHSGPGIYLTTDESIASNLYAKGHGSSSSGRVLRAMVVSKKPFGAGVFSKQDAVEMNAALVKNGYTPVKNLEGKTHQWLFDRKQEQAQDTWDSVMKDAGYDSVMIPGADESELVVYDPKQLVWIDKSPATPAPKKFKLIQPQGQVDPEIETERGNITMRIPVSQNPDGTFSANEAMLFVPPGILESRVADRTTIDIQRVIGKTEEEARRLAAQGIVDELNKGGDLSNLAPQEPPSTPAPVGGEPTTAQAGATPAKAEAKMAAEVSEVARTEGQRPAKEVKAELIAKIEKEIESAPTEEQVKGHSYTKANMETVWVNPEVENVTIDIPGDGTFTIRKTKEALGEILKRAKRLEVRTDYPEPRVSRKAITSSTEALRRSGEQEGSPTEGMKPVQVERFVKDLEKQLQDVEKKKREVRAKYKGVSRVSFMNRTTPRIERGQAFDLELGALEAQERNISSQIAKAREAQPTAKPATTEIQKAHDAVTKAWDEYRGSTLGATPSGQLPKELQFYKSLVNLARAYIKQGVGTFADFVQSAGLNDTAALMRAWAEAKGTQPVITTLDGLTPDQLQSLGNSGVQSALPKPSVAAQQPMGRRGPPPAQNVAAAPAPGTTTVQTQTGQYTITTGAAAPAPGVPPFPTAGLVSGLHNLSQERTMAGVKQQMSWMKDAGETTAGNTAHQDAKKIELKLRRAVTGVSLPTVKERLGKVVKPWKDKLEVAKAALSFVVESESEIAKMPRGSGTLAALDVFRNRILNSQFSNTLWSTKALAAIDFAESNIGKLQPIAKEYTRILDDQLARERFNGFTVGDRPGYVMHMQEMVDPFLRGFRDLFNIEERGGMGSGFFKERVHDTFSHSIAAGIDPVTLDAIGLMERRLSGGRTMLAHKAWESSLRGVVDPTSGLEIVTSPIKTKSGEYQAPPGYDLVKFGNRMIAVQRPYRTTFRELTDPSKLEGFGWNTILKSAISAKHGMLLFDTYHLGRIAYHSLILQNVFPYGAEFRGVPFSSKGLHKYGLALVDLSRADIVDLANRGEIPKDWLPHVHEDKRIIDGLINQGGYNLGGISDAIYSDWVRQIPVSGAFNKFLFDEFQRGAMAQSGVIQFKRLRKANPNLPESDVFRMVGRDLNYRYGNLRSQGWIKSRTMQDFSRLFFLAPQWNEGLIRSEVGAMAQTGKAGLDIARLRKPVYGTLMRQAATLTIAGFVGNQLLNWITRGKPTWQNEEDGHKLSAFIPDVVGEGRGYFLNPVALPMEISHLLLKNMEIELGKTPPGAAGVGQAMLNAIGKVAVTREGYMPRVLLAALLRIDPFGEKIHPSQYQETVSKLAIPSPIAGDKFFNATKSLLTSGGVDEKIAGETQKQMMQSFGIRTDTVPSAGSQFRSKLMTWMKSSDDPELQEAYKVAADRQKMEGAYTKLRTALSANNPTLAQQEYGKLIESAHKPEDIEKAMRPYVGRGAAMRDKPIFSRAKIEQQFLDTLGPKELELYEQAQAERRVLWDRFQSLSLEPPSPKTRKLRSSQ